MKGYIASILIVGLAFGGMGFGTFAWPTDSEAVKENVIETGNVNLIAWASKPQGNGGEDEKWKGPLEVTNLVPSNDNWKTMGYIHLKNDGTVPLKWRGYFEEVGSCDSLELDKILEFKFKIKESDGDGWIGPSKTYTWTDISDANGTPLNWKTFDAILDCPGKSGGNQNDKKSLVIEVQVKLNENAGIDYKNKQIKFNIVFLATQF